MVVGAMGTCANAQSGFVHDPAKKNLHGGGGGGTDDDVDDDDTGPLWEDGSMMYGSTSRRQREAL
jgi:hypothetical protein